MNYFHAKVKIPHIKGATHYFMDLVKYVRENNYPDFDFTYLVFGDGVEYLCTRMPECSSFLLRDLGAIAHGEEPDEFYAPRIRRFEQGIYYLASLGWYIYLAERNELYYVS